MATFTNGAKVQFTLTGGTQNGTWSTGRIFKYDEETDTYMIRTQDGTYYEREACYVRLVKYAIRKARTDGYHYIYVNGKKVEHTAYGSKSAAQIAVNEMKKRYN